MKIIAEPKITFGEFHEDDLFHIEESSLYKHVQQKHHAKTVEFLYLQHRGENPPFLCVVEAKSSIPRKPEEFFLEIKAKFTDSLALTTGLLLGTYNKYQEELPKNFTNLAERAPKIKLILVIGSVPEEHLPPLGNELDRELKDILRMVKIAGFDAACSVFNEEMARKYGLAGIKNKPVKQ